MANDIDHYVVPATFVPDWPVQPLSENDRSLLADIERVFTDPQPTHKMSWLEAEGVDCGEDESTRATLRARDYVQRWQETNDGVLAAHPSASRYLDDESFLFYLPAIMQWGIRYGRHAQAPAVCDRAEEIGAYKAHRELIDRLSPEQRAVYGRWLAAMNAT